MRHFHEQAINCLHFRLIAASVENNRFKLLLALAIVLFCSFSGLVTQHTSTVQNCASSCQPHTQAELIRSQKFIADIEREPIPPNYSWTTTLAILTILYSFNLGRQKEDIFNNRLFVTTRVLRF